MAKSNRVFTNQEILEIKELYLSGVSIKKLEKLYRTTYRTLVNKVFKPNNMTLRTQAQSKQIFNIDEKFYDVIDTEVKAYSLGLMYADGYVYKKLDVNKGNSYQSTISLKKGDEYVLKEIQNNISPDRKLIRIKHGRNSYTEGSMYYRMCITNKYLAERLIEIGLRDKEHFPSVIPKELYHHFIRGVFDGDGCISVGQRTSKGKYVYVRAEVNIMGQKNFLLTTKDILLQNNIKVSNITFVRNIYKFRTSSIKEILKFENYIYKDSTIYLKRKKEKFAVLRQKLQKS